MKSPTTMLIMVTTKTYLKTPTNSNKQEQNQYQNQKQYQRRTVTYPCLPMAVNVAMSMNSDIVPAPGLWVHMDPSVDATATVTPVMPRTFPNLKKNKMSVVITCDMI